MNDTRLGYTLDNQQAHSYFQALSFTAEEIVNRYVRKVSWTPNSDLEHTGGKLDVYVLDPRFLLVSKLVGFARSPRDKDLQDIRALAEVLRSERSLGVYEDLLQHIPFMTPGLRANKALIGDLLSIDAAQVKRETGTRLAARFLQELVAQFPADPEAGEQNARQFVKLLTSVYRDGLSNSFTAHDLGIRADLLDRAVTAGRLKGFWQTTEDGPELRIFMQDGAAHEIHRLRLMQKASVQLGYEVESLEPTSQKSIWEGRLSAPHQNITVVVREEVDELPLLCRKLVWLGKEGSFAAAGHILIDEVPESDQVTSRRISVFGPTETESLTVEIGWSNILPAGWGTLAEPDQRCVGYLVVKQLLIEGRAEEYRRYAAIFSDLQSSWSGPVFDFLSEGLQNVLARDRKESMLTLAKEIFTPIQSVLGEIDPHTFPGAASELILASAYHGEFKYTAQHTKTAIDAISEAIETDLSLLIERICLDSYESEKHRSWSIKLAGILPPDLFKRVRDGFIRTDCQKGMSESEFEEANSYYQLTGRDLTRVRRQFAAADMGRAMQAIGYSNDTPDKIAIARYLRRSMKFCRRTKNRGVAPEPHYHESAERWAVLESVAQELGDRERAFVAQCRVRSENYYKENRR
jgi:hypothetical protein